MVSPNKNSSLFFSIGFGLICLIGLMDLLASLSFLVHIPLTPWHFLIAVTLALICVFYYTTTLKLRDNWGHFLKTSGGILVILGVSMLIAANIYDISFDGQYYHQEAIYHMGHEHWNPFYATVTLPDNMMGAVWVNHYPKQSETTAALVYASTQHIESGKAFNIILLIASFCLTFSFLRQYTRFGAGKVWLLSILFAFNPVAIHQLFTYLVDGQLASLLLSLLMVCLFIYHGTGRDKLLLFFFLIITCLNVKLTAILFTGIFIIFLLIMLFLNKQMKSFWRVFVAAAVGTITAVLLVGFNPFVTNTITKQNPFYPLLGKHPIDIMTFTSPAGFPEKNRFEKMFITIFSHTDNIDKQVTDRVPQLKIPFTFNKLDIKSLAYPDNRIGGFGPLFSGIFLLVVFFVVWLLIYRRQTLTKNYMAGILLMLVFSVLILEEAWWARYVPQFWFIPVVILILVESANNKWITGLKNFTYCIMLINLCMCFGVMLQTNVLKTAEINEQLAQLKATGQPIHVGFNRFDSNRVRFDEHDIPYVKAQVPESDSSAVAIIYSRARVKVDKPLPVLPQRWFLRFVNYLKGKK
jgi:hypothetical protein